MQSCHHEELVADSIYVNKRVLLCILSGKIEFDFEDGMQTIAPTISTTALSLNSNRHQEQSTFCELSINNIEK
ncbi:MAG: hypothetical protein AAF363_19270 [Bacteroidota bacterium]